MNLEILHKSKPTDDSVSLHFRKSGLLEKYKAGQHALLSFKIDGEVFKRTYSFHTAPDTDAHVAITVRAVDGGRVSNYLQATNNAPNIYLDGVSGDFTIEAQSGNKRHLVMFAGGSGITPIMGMIKTILYNEPDSTVCLVYSNKHYARIIFKNELQELEEEFSGRLTTHHILTQEEHAPADFPVFYKGRLSKLIIRKLLKQFYNEIPHPFEYYLCGPFSFMELVQDAILSVSPDASIFKEHFFIPDIRPEFDTSDLQRREVILRVQDFEQVLTVPAGKTILEAALDRDITLPHSCREGQCGTCRALLVAGEVKLRRNHVLTENEVREGHILLCQAFPASEGVTIREHSITI